MEPIVTAEFRLDNLSDKTARDLLRNACTEAAHGPVPILNKAGGQIGAIVSPEAAEDARRFAEWRAMAELGDELAGNAGACSPGPGVGC